MADLTAVRARAWKTRRERYGERGHGGSYTRWSRDPVGCRALALVVRLHHEEALSEGQCCAALGMERVAFRKLCDAQTEREG